MGTSTQLMARMSLGAALRRHRDEIKGMTLAKVAGHLGVTDSLLSRIETGKRTCSQKLFAELMDLFEVPEGERDELSTLLADSRDRRLPWWATYREFISASYERLISFEDAAERVLEYQVGIVPGLLQTEEYARAVIGVGFASLGPDQIDGLVEVRTLRQRHRLDGSRPMVCQYVITQGVLQYQVGGQQAHRDQLHRLLELSEQDTIDLRVIPYEKGEEGTQTGAYRILQFPGGDMPDVAFGESVAGSIVLDDPRDLRRLHRLHQNLTAAALGPDKTRDLIAKIMTEGI